MLKSIFLRKHGQVCSSNFLYKGDLFSLYRDINELRNRHKDGRDVPPISAALDENNIYQHIEVFKALFLKALNDNQFFLLKHIEKRSSSLNSLLRGLSKEHDISLSTLKHNARVLRDLDLIDYGSKHDPKPVTLTEPGKIILCILKEGEKDDRIGGE